MLAVIPARGGSKGIPNKNIVPLLGKPLINWTIEAAQSSRYIDQLILSSDDERICAVAEAAGCDVPFIRESGLATDEAETIDVVIDVLDRIQGFEVVILLQPTSPLRASADIDKCLELLVDCRAKTAVSVTPVEEHPFLMYSLSADARLDPFIKVGSARSLRRQELPPAYTLNGAIYAAEVSWLRESKSFVSPDAVGYVMPRATSIDIDEQSDLERAAEYLSNRSGSFHQ